MTLLIVDNVVLRTRPSDENSENCFRAAQCLEENRRIIYSNGKPKNDTAWMMKILPTIAKFFNYNRHEILQIWVQDYGLKALNL